MVFAIRFRFVSPDAASDCFVQLRLVSLCVFGVTVFFLILVVSSSYLVILRIVTARYCMINS